MAARILCINGSLGGSRGNTAKLLQRCVQELAAGAECRELHLAETPAAEWMSSLAWAEGFVFSTGTYWDSWGSPLQEFFERATGTEASEIWLGKPAAVLVSMHAVGGKGVLSRLQGVLNTLGCSLPPMSGFVYSLANQLALESPSSFADDFWRPDDLAMVAANLLAAFAPRGAVRAWPVDRADPKRLWISD